MSVRQLGGLTIGRMLEQTTPFAASMFFPKVSAQQWEPYKHWLQPDAMDPVTGDLLLPMQDRQQCETIRADPVGHKSGSQPLLRWVVSV